MLKIWTGGVSADAFVLSSVSVNVEMNPGAIVVTDRSGIPHRIETEFRPRPVRMDIEFPANLLALENSSEIKLGDFLTAAYRTGGHIVLMESTRQAAFRGYIERLGDFVAGARGRAEWQPETARIGFLLIGSGTYADWDNVSSTEWEE